MMSLTREAAGFFTQQVRMRGRNYAQRGRVRLRQTGPREVLASVRGTSAVYGDAWYNVRLSRNGQELQVRCECPYYRSGKCCKHIWATLLVCEQQGELTGNSQEEKIRHLRMILPGRAEDVGQAGALPAATALPEEPHVTPDEPSLSLVPGQGIPTDTWRHRLGLFQRVAREARRRQMGSLAVQPEIFYVIDVKESIHEQNLILKIMHRGPSEDSFDLKPARIRRNDVPLLHDATDRFVLGLLSGVEDQEDPLWASYNTSFFEELIAGRYRLRVPFPETILPHACRSGRCHLELPDGGFLPTPLLWDEGQPLELCIRVRESAELPLYEVTGSLRRGDEHYDPASLVMSTADGLLYFRDRLARLATPEWYPWVPLASETRPIRVPLARRDEFLAELLQSPGIPRLDLPEEMSFETVSPPPRSLLTIRPARPDAAGRNRLEGEVTFDYGGLLVAADDSRPALYAAGARRLVRRDAAAETAALAQLADAGFRRRPSDEREVRSRYDLAAGRLGKAVRALLASGWVVEAEGKTYRRPGKLDLEVSSGIDWFDLKGGVEFEDLSAPLPQLLAAIRHGEEFLKLDDGSLGMIPEEWVKKYGLLARLGSEGKDRLRFSAAQAGLLDVLLSSEPEARIDRVFAEARERLRTFQRVEPMEPGPGFHGVLRGYQKEGLGWLHFLRTFGFGGCLADDMGLGKTVMVLALLESRAALRQKVQAPGSARQRPEAAASGSQDHRQESDRSGSPRPSLVVVPRSLLFNWQQEAARFTPGLRVLAHFGPPRSRTGEEFEAYDMVLTTYGTLRRDALLFNELTFDYVVLDEAQAVKNASTESSRIVRLLHADHRLALSGTPVENHLGELWSLFEFLNPGMLGKASVFRLSGAGARRPDPESVEFLARGLKPFILRRTKEQVAQDLPPRVEQTIFCDLLPGQRKLYDELKAHYRAALAGLIESQGLARSKMQVLEALLRLRQAACHPGLIDKSRSGEKSAKLDVLISQIEQVSEENHKAIVFSQFTSFLRIVRHRLDADGVVYEYLDGKTTNRGERVARFQTDPDCRLFLISLKAGGLGLNLTAAEYVYLLDPWWNPAVEAQAIDRAHRIGQERKVFAYRIISRGTVEEKVLELQDTKRALAEALIGADDNLLRKLTRKDLELLLS